MDEQFIIRVDPRLLQGSDATDHACQMCYVRPANHVHHVEFKKMGGRGVKAKAYIERAENKREVCMTRLRRVWARGNGQWTRLPRLKRSSAGLKRTTRSAAPENSSVKPGDY
jgi:hypothetical protein